MNALQETIRRGEREGLFILNLFFMFKESDSQESAFYQDSCSRKVWQDFKS